MRIEYQRSCEAMGTRFEVILRGEDAQHLEAVAVAVCEEFLRLDAALSRFNSSSEIARLNREAIDKAVRIDREIFALLERCEQARDLTEGYFDVTAASGGARIELDAERCAVRFIKTDAAPDAEIDLGAIGKGYALDCGREILQRYGVEIGLLNGGTSSLLAIGGAFAVDVRHPLTPELIVRRIELSNRALSCSAARHPAQAQSDVINPLTGAALAGDAACVVLAASAADAEIFSTALLAMGREKAERYLEKMICAGLQVEWF
jgi:thiamine biosynthesis lipoprotein